MFSHFNRIFYQSLFLKSGRSKTYQFDHWWQMKQFQDSDWQLKKNCMTKMVTRDPGLLGVRLPLHCCRLQSRQTEEHSVMALSQWRTSFKINSWSIQDSSALWVHSGPGYSGAVPRTPRLQHSNKSGISESTLNRDGKLQLAALGDIRFSSWKTKWQQKTWLVQHR